MTRSAGLAKALPMVAAIVAAAILSESPSRVRAPLDAAYSLWEMKRFSMTAEWTARQDRLVLEVFVGSHPDSRVHDFSEHACGHAPGETPEALFACHFDTYRPEGIRASSRSYMNSKYALDNTC